MNKNKVIHFKLYALIWLIMLIVLYVVTLLILKATGTYTHQRIRNIVIPVSLVLAFFVKKILLKHEQNKPIGIKYSEMLREIQTNGYSDRFFQIVDEASYLCAEKNDCDSNYYVEFMLYAASGYSLKKEYDKALRYINSIDTNKIRSKEQEFLDQGQQLALYFDTQMCICQGMGDVVRADNVLRDAKNYIDRYYKAGGMNALAIDDMYCAYYYVKGDYENEFAHATRIMESKLPDAAKNPMAYLRILEVYCKTGQKENAEEMHKLLKQSLLSPKNPNADILIKYADDVMAEIS